MPKPIPTSSGSAKPKATVLDDATSARALAEFVVIRKVKAKEISAILAAGNRGATDREIALTFRISDVLGIPDAFVMAPRFRSAFAALRRLMLKKPADGSA